MGKHAVTVELLQIAHNILQFAFPQTVRQVFYQLVSRLVLENSEGSYKKVSRLLADGRQDGSIPWEWIEDRNRRPREVLMWDSPDDFLTGVLPQYRRDVWEPQPRYVEVWLEKDALSGIVEDVIQPFGVTLAVGRGYDGWSSINWAAGRYKKRTARGQAVHVLYLGDHDPSGNDMERSLRDRLASLDCRPTIRKIALNRELIDHHRLPPSPTKLTDSRRAAFVAEHGDETVELDALPVQILRQLLRTELQSLIDIPLLEATFAAEREERESLYELLKGA